MHVTTLMNLNIRQEVTEQTKKNRSTIGHGFGFSLRCLCLLLFWSAE